MKEYELNEMQKAWVKGLRSGEYKQGKDWLQKGDEYCCLGVACRVLNDEFKVPVETDHNGNIEYAELGPQPHVMESLGLRGQCGDNFDNNDCLVVLNDRDDYSFEQIADYIEEHKTGLFKLESLIEVQ